MYYVYDWSGCFVGKLASWSWAERLADAYSGWVEDYDGFVVYDCMDIYDTCFY